MLRSGGGQEERRRLLTVVQAEPAAHTLYWGLFSWAHGYTGIAHQHACNWYTLHLLDQPRHRSGSEIGNNKEKSALLFEKRETGFQLQPPNGATNRELGRPMIYLFSATLIAGTRHLRPLAWPIWIAARQLVRRCRHHHGHSTTTSRARGRVMVCGRGQRRRRQLVHTPSRVVLLRRRRLVMVVLRRRLP
jgi:hypothetical protein